ncbi:MAG: 2-oxoacid:acceptor oxidoreductase family protein [bacterium]|jgi:2-oxoglutarate ferredoxin oxidoreductase subunit gamma|nr:2-oxoacid:acceptor oxidoreductase family protein [bacterium]
MNLTQIKIGGFGGQGVIMTGIILGKAASIYDKMNATMTRSYGPEARGGACSAQVVLDTEPIAYPYVVKPDILIVMSQEACDRYSKDLPDGAVLLYESDLVKPKTNGKSFQLYGIPTTRIAEDLGNRVVQNIVMLGYLAKISQAISKKAIEEAIKNSVPKKTIELNVNAFEEGFNYEVK